MISSVKKRKENAHKFSLCYEDICKLQNRVPLPCVKAHLKKDILDFNGDRVTYDEWGPILNALSLDRSLHFIGVRSTHKNKSALEDITTESKVRALERLPVLQSRFVLLLLMKSLRMCMINTEALTCMELEGLPLSKEYLSELIEGVKNCVSLQNISLNCSPVGDEGCDMLCQTIKQLSNIVSVDMSNCGLTEQGAASVADIIKYQKIHRHSESWKQTLRYREADLESLPGLRRITLNHNTKILDHGLILLVDVIRDDLFLKALDMQNCGVGDTGGMAVLDMLKSNVSLAIVDLRANRDLNSDLLRGIMHQLHINNQGCAVEYHWIAVDRFQLSHQPRRSRPRTSSQASKRTASSEELFHPRSSKSDSPLSLRSKSSAPGKGIPWRISERIIRRKEHSSVCPGTPRAVQFQEQIPPFHARDQPSTSPRAVQLERAKQQIVWLSQQLSAEVSKCQKLEEENRLLKKQLSEYPGEDAVVMKRSTVQEMERSLAEFQVITRKLRELGLDPGASQILTRKSHSEHATRQTSRHNDKHRVSKSACAVSMYSAVRVEAGVGDRPQKGLSSEGTAGTLTYLECSSDSGGASCEDSDTQERDHANTQATLYQTVLHKNRELSYLTEDNAY